MHSFNSLDCWWYCTFFLSQFRIIWTCYLHILFFLSLKTTWPKPKLTQFTPYQNKKMSVRHRFSIKNIFYDKMGLRLFYFDVTIRAVSAGIVQSNQLIVQSNQWKHQSNVWNPRKVSNKNTRTTSLMLFRYHCFFNFELISSCLFCWFWTCKWC